MSDQPHSDGEQPANEIHPFNLPEGAKREHECLLWERRREWQRRQEVLLACQLLELAAVLLRATLKRQAQEKERRRRRTLQARPARPRGGKIVTWYA